MRYINEIIIHCTATKAGTDIGVKEIRRYHKNVKGWSDIGYHYLVRLDGTVERGRYISQPGAHCLHHNAHSIGIAYVGGLDASGQPADTRTEAQRKALIQIIAKNVSMFHCPVYGHRDFAPKECPCFDAKNEYKLLVNSILAKK